jgi:hypothetical protein
MLSSNENGGRRGSTRRGLELTQPLKRPDWIPYSRAKTEERGWYPNRLYYNHENDVVIECQRSGDSRHWSLSATAARDTVTAERNGKVRQGYVRFINADGSYAFHETLQNVLRAIGSQTTNTGKHGDYWWLDENLKVRGPMNPSDEGGPL